MHDSGVLAIRERSALEAIDLGAVLLRRFPLPVYACAGLPLIILTLALWYFLPLPWLAVLILWWIKPLWAQLALVQASHLVFHPRAGARELLGRLRHLKPLELLHDLSWRRFSPYRSYLLPVRLLEGLKGTVKSKRQNQLARRSAGACLLFSTAMVLMEWTFWFCTIFFLVNIGLPEAGMNLVQTEEGPAWAVLVYGFCVLVFEPFFALGGFGLYLNSRTIIEGWDLALVFRGIGPAARALALVLLGTFLLCGQPAGLAAQATGAGQDWQALAKEVLEDPEFGSQTTVPVVHWRKGADKLLEDAEVPMPNALATASSQTLLWIVAIIGGLALVALVITMLRRRARSLRAEGGGVAEGDALIRLEAWGAPQSGVANWASQAESLWQAGRQADAIALLYRACLELFGERRGLRVPESATEGDCLALVRAARGLEPEARELFAGLVRARLITGYALHPLDAADFRVLHGGLLAWRDGPVRLGGEGA